MTTSTADRVLRRHTSRPTTQFFSSSSDSPSEAGVSLRISVRPGDGPDVVELAGEVDLATAPLLRSTIRRLLTDGRNHITVDLDGVTFLDSAALSVLINATSDVSQAGGTLHVKHHPRCLLLLKITGETHRVNVTGSPPQS